MKGSSERAPDSTLVVFLPQTRAYGWDFAPLPHPVFVAGRVFRVVSHPEPDRCYVRPLEGGPAAAHSPGFFVSLGALPPVNLSSDEVQLGDVEELMVDGVGHYLGLSRVDWTDVSPSYRIPQVALGSKGIVSGRVYRLARWFVPARVIQLQGVEGGYYAGLFVSAQRRSDVSPVG